MEDDDIKIAVVSETWLTSITGYVTGYLRERGYLIHHHHRVGQRGGGVAIIFANTLTIEHSKVHSFKSFECVSASFTGHPGKTLHFTAIYRCGDHLEPMSVFLREFNDLVEFLHFTYPDIVVCGDFNIHCNDTLNSDVIKFYEILNSFSLVQHVSVPTHDLGNTIDLVISNPNNVQITNLSVCADTPSDHSLIYFTINFDAVPTKPVLFRYRNLRQINSFDFKADLESKLTEFQSLNLTSGFENAITMYNQIQQDVLDKHAPLKEKLKYPNTKPAWMDREFKEARADRRKKYKKWKRTQAESDKELYVNARTFVAQLVISKKKDYYSRRVSNCQNSQSELFSMCKNLLDKPRGSTVPQTSDPMDLANKFNNYFCDKVVKIRNNLTPPAASCQIQNTCSVFPADSATLDQFEPVTEVQLEKIIKASKIKTSPDDPIPAELLKDNIDLVLPSLVKLVNLSLTTGEMNGLKDTVVTPLLKKAGADPEDLSNYRPITGIQYLGKLIERSVLPQLSQHALLNKLHIPKQSGYKPGYSCETLLVRLVNDIFLNLDNGLCTVLLLMDFSAAFDLVVHAILLAILHTEYGIRGTALKWFESFLKGRRQAVTINNTKSDYQDNPFGVPQGSVLGPVLFNIYVRGMIPFLESKGFNVHGYADDHQAFKAFRIQFQFEAIRNGLPKFLGEVNSWVQKFFLKLNATKSQVIVFTPDSQSSKLLVQRLFLDDGSILPLSRDVLNLGMILDHKLSFGPQIDRVICACYQLLRDISSIRRFLTEDEIKSLVNSVVVARIDNCNSVYAGLSAHHILRLQRLQNSCARVIYGVGRRNHVSELLKKLHWLPIRQRIVFKVLCLIFKCIHGTAPSYLSDILPLTHENRFVRIPRTKTSYGDQAFSRLGPMYWNALPTHIRIIPGIVTFKSKLKHYLFSSSSDYFNVLNRYRNWIPHNQLV